MVSHVDDLFLFPLAFLILVLGKAYGIAKAALVPTVVDDDSELVRANSRLSLISGIVGLVVGAPAALIVKFIGPEAALVCAAITSATAAVLATRLSAAAVAPTSRRTPRRKSSSAARASCTRQRRWGCSAASSASSRSCSRSP